MKRISINKDKAKSITDKVREYWRHSDEFDTLINGFNSKIIKAAEEGKSSLHLDVSLIKPFYWKVEYLIDYLKDQDFTIKEEVINPTGAQIYISWN